MPSQAHPGHGFGAPRGAAAGSGLVHACVVAGDVSIPYVQGGDGPPILLLRAGHADTSTSLLSWATLSRDYRILAPVLERGGLVHADGDGGAPVAFSRWLRDFLDGLGLEQVPLVAEEPFGVPALDYALSDPERVRSIALVFRDVHDPGLSTAVVVDVLTPTGTSVAVVRVGTGPGSVGASSADVVRFLSDAEEPHLEGVVP